MQEVKKGTWLAHCHPAQGAVCICVLWGCSTPRDRIPLERRAGGVLSKASVHLQSQNQGWIGRGLPLGLSESGVLTAASWTACCAPLHTILLHAEGAVGLPTVHSDGVRSQGRFGCQLEGQLHDASHWFHIKPLANPVILRILMPWAETGLKWSPSSPFYSPCSPALG